MENCLQKCLVNRNISSEADPKPSSKINFDRTRRYGSCVAAYGQGRKKGVQRGGEEGADRRGLPVGVVRTEGEGCGWPLGRTRPRRRDRERERRGEREGEGLEQ